ncbi:MAG: hypothetical protein PVI80_05595, partial [Anaerolineae bacterium]
CAIIAQLFLRSDAMSGRGPNHRQLNTLLAGFGLGDGVTLRPSVGNPVFDNLIGTTTTTTTMRWHQPGALRGGGLK